MNLIKYITIDEMSNILKNYPLYSQDGKKDPLVILEVFIPNQNMYWLLTEGNKEDDDFTFFGYCKIQCGELGYVSFKELSDLNYNINFIYHKEPIKLSELKKKYNTNLA